MTAKEKAPETCMDCPHFLGAREVYPLKSLTPQTGGTCACPQSSHYGHLLWPGHLACEVWAIAGGEA